MAIGGEIPSREEMLGRFGLSEFGLGQTPETEGKLPIVKQETPSDVRELIKMHLEKHDLVTEYLRDVSEGIREKLPFIFLDKSQGEFFGDFYAREGEKDLLDAQVDMVTDPFNPDERVAELIGVVKKMRGESNRKDETVTCLRGLKKNWTGSGSRWKLAVGPGKYSDFYYTNGSEGLSLNPSDYIGKNIEAENLRFLQDFYNSHGRPKTVRDYIYKLYGGLPDFNEPVYGHTMGVATMLLTKDEYFVYAERNPKRVGVNAGINCPASGGVQWNEEVLRESGIVGNSTTTMKDEAAEELGLKLSRVVFQNMNSHLHDSLGLQEGDYDLHFVGGVRELPRGGSPEFLFLASSHLSLEQIIKLIQHNESEEKLEAKKFFAQKAGAAFAMVSEPGGENILQAKGAINLLLAREFLKKA